MGEILNGSLVHLASPAADVGRNHICGRFQRRRDRGAGDQQRSAGSVAGLAKAVVSTTPHEHPDERRAVQ